MCHERMLRLGEVGRHAITPFHLTRQLTEQISPTMVRCFSGLSLIYGSLISVDVVVDLDWLIYVASLRSDE